MGQMIFNVGDKAYYGHEEAVFEAEIIKQFPLTGRYRIKVVQSKHPYEAIERTIVQKRLFKTKKEYLQSALVAAEEQHAQYSKKADECEKLMARLAKEIENAK